MCIMFIKSSIELYAKFHAHSHIARLLFVVSCYHITSHLISFFEISKMSLRIDFVLIGTQISGDVPAVLKALEEIGNQLRSYIEQCLRVYLIHMQF